MILAYAAAILLISLLPGLVACVCGLRSTIVLSLSAQLPPISLLVAGILLDKSNAVHGGDLQGAYTSFAAWYFPVPLSIGLAVGGAALWIRSERFRR